MRVKNHDLKKLQSFFQNFAEIIFDKANSLYYIKLYVWITASITIIADWWIKKKKKQINIKNMPIPSNLEKKV